jgi:hypothetical protein
VYYPFSCNSTVVRVAIDIHSKLQILSASVWYYNTPSIATRQWFELQSMYTWSCKYWVLPPDTVLPLLLQPDNGSGCNCYTLWVAITKFFRLILYPFSCNRIVVRVPIDIHFEMQILSVSACYFTTPWVAMQHWFELQLLYTPSCKYWVLPPDTILLLQLQPNSGSSCNWYTVRVANTKRFHLILYYPFSCNPIAVRVAIDIHSELQILSVSAWYCTTTSVATRYWVELQLIYTLSCKY